MSEPRDPELDGLVELLRGATPSNATLSIARARVMADAAAPVPSTTLTILARLGLLTTVLLALGLGSVLLDSVLPDSVLLDSVLPDSVLPDSVLPDSVLPGAVEVGTVGGPSASLLERAPRAPIAEHPTPSDPPLTLEAPSTDPAATREPAATGRAHRPPVRRLPAALNLELSPPVAVPPRTGPSPTLASALRDFASGRWAEAATKLEEVAERRTDDGPAQIAQADFFLAKCLYHLELFHASATAFEEVTRRGDAHPYFVESLPYLAMLSARLPEPSLLVESVGRYEEAQIAEAPAGHQEELLWLLGRHRYDTGRFDEAARIFSALRRVEARFYEGLSHVRRHRTAPALAAFRRVTETSASGSLHSELAWMSIARLHYALATQQPERSDATRARHLRTAIAAWRHVPVQSSRWLDAFYEETWAHYMANDHARALGHIHTLQSPELRAHSNPEALVIRAMIQLEHCQWRSAERTLAGFHEAYDPMLADAERTHRMAATPEDAFRLLRAVRDHRSRVPTSVRPAMERAFGDHELDRHLAAVSAIERERARLVVMHRALFGPALRSRIETELAIQHALAVDHAGELAEERVRRVRDELRERMVQMDTVEVELSSARRDELQRPAHREQEPAEGGPIVAQQGGHVWPFDGEFWPDEATQYRQEIGDRCGP